MKELWKKWVIECGSTFSAVSMPLIAVMVILAVIGSCEQGGNGNGRETVKPEPVREAPEKRTTIRQDVSAMWHHAKCAVKFCDEDGRCPVWSSSYSKCYMLDKDGEDALRIFEKTETEKWSFEKFFVK